MIAARAVLLYRFARFGGQEPSGPAAKEHWGTSVMLRVISGLLVATTLALPAAATVANRDHAKRHSKVVWHGYGFLPGYRPPEQIERQTPPAPTGHYFYGFPGYNFYGGPQFYRGRWNGGGFGECWTQTPIGPHWNCG